MTTKNLPYDVITVAETVVVIVEEERAHSMVDPKALDYVLEHFEDQYWVQLSAPHVVDK